MLHQIGKRASSEDVVDLLQECHGRIRRFLVMARELAAASNAPPAEIVATAAQIRRYFVESFPLHVEDEEIDIAPRIAPALAAELLQRMQADHRTHSSPVAELIAQCSTLERQPEQHADVAPRLHPLAHQLSTELESHMEFEERTVFPALRNLPQAERDAILVAMRQRRAATLGA